MNKTSLLMLVVGTILGIVIGYVTFSAKPEVIIEAHGFRDIGYDKGKVNIELVKRVDEDTIDAFKVIQVPLEGFLRGHGASAELIKTLVEQDLVKAPTANAPDANDSPDE